VSSMYPTRHPGGPPPRWSIPPGWGQPLDDLLLLHAAGPIGHWLWPTVSVAGFLLVTAFTLAHDDPAPGLSGRGLLTITLAAAVVILLTIRRAAGPRPLARALAEYTVVFLLAVLVATTGVDLDQAPAAGRRASAAPDQRPALVKTIDRSWDRLAGAWDWLAELWRRADHQTSPRPRPASVSAPAVPTSTRRPL
jgi:hypothetical protein